jgi:transposase
MTTARDRLTKADTILVAAIESGAPDLVEARNLLDRFHAMIRTKGGKLKDWIRDAGTSLVASFASGIGKDEAAVAAAIAEPWSNGQVEGQITKLKLVKRQMYGRAKLDLLEARLLPAAWSRHHKDCVRARFRRRSTVWTKESDRFRLDPSQHIPALYT